ncbi:MAG TPA: SDR family oxidoreductase [Candidatus Acidoferrum sp.]|nr:SDR family oxidoreductase [Candidatus Acidoferrum sp.]
MTKTHFKTVLVTGGSDGLGRAAAIFLAERNYTVFATGRDTQRLQALQQLANDKNLPLETFEMDICKDASVDAAVSAVEKRAGTPDVLINNAGIAIVAAMEEVAIADLTKQFETNVFGAVRVAQRVLPGMRTKRHGRIINMSSILGKVVHPLWGPYSASKHALEAISDAMRLELYPFGIDVVVIEPGYIGTNIKQKTGAHSASYSEKAKASPYAAIYDRLLQQWLRASNDTTDTPEDCARVIQRAIEDTPPKTRYPVTRTAHIWTIARRFYTDRALDRRFQRDFGLDKLRESLEEQGGNRARAVISSDPEHEG